MRSPILTLLFPLLTFPPLQDQPQPVRTQLIPREKIPGPPSDWKVSASAEADLIRLSLSPSAEAKIELKDVSFFPEQSELIDYVEPQVLTKTDRGFVLELKKSKFFGQLPARIQGVLFSSEGWGEAHGKPAIRINVKFNRVNPKPKELKK